MIERWQGMGRNTRIVAVAMMLWGIGEGLWLHIQPLYLSSLGASPEESGFILSATGLARLLIMLPAGVLSDRYGARQVMLPGWFLGTVGVILVAVAPHLGVVAMGLFFYGMSSFSMPILNLYLIQSTYQDRSVKTKLKPQEVLTFIYALYWMAQIVSPAIGGAMADMASLRAVFWVSAGWFILSTLMIFQTEAYAPPARVQSSLRMALREYRQMLRQRQLGFTYAIFTLAFILAVLGYTFASQYLVDVRHLSKSTIGFLVSAIAAGGFGWNLLLGQRSAWRGFLAAVGITALSFGLLMISGNVVVMLGALFCMGALEVLRPLTTGIVASQTMRTTQGGAFGLVDTLYGAAMLIAPGLAGILYAQGENWPFYAAMLLTPLVFAGVAWLHYRPVKDELLDY